MHTLLSDAGRTVWMKGGHCSRWGASQHVKQTRAAAWWATLQAPLDQRKGRLALQGPVLNSGN